MSNKDRETRFKNNVSTSGMKKRVRFQASSKTLDVKNFDQGLLEEP